MNEQRRDYGDILETSSRVHTHTQRRGGEDHYKEPVTSAAPDVDDPIIGDNKNSVNPIIINS